MSFPELDPKPNTPAIVLPETGSESNVSSSLPFGIYGEPSSPQYSDAFISGAVDQVSFTYKRLGGDVIDIELTEENVYAAYEEAVLEYSNLINMHQAENALGNTLGSTTGSFDEDGVIQSGSLSSSLDGQGIELKFPKFQFTYERRIGQGLSMREGVGGDKSLHSASVNAQPDVQNYDLRKAVKNNSTGFTGSIDGKQIIVTKVYYQTPRAAWRFYGYYGGMNVVGNLHNYGQYSDDSTFELIPTWQNKMQAIQYEDAIYTRLSHFSYEIHNNELIIYPSPDSVGPDRVWFKFYIPDDPWKNEEGDNTVDGINNYNTLPFQNLPYESINSMGKQWIRNYALAISKEMLGQVRTKYDPIPIPNENISLNGDALLSQASEEKQQLRDELKEKLDKLTYDSVMERKKKLKIYQLSKKLKR